MKRYEIPQNDRGWFTRSIAEELCLGLQYGHSKNKVQKVLLEGTEEDIYMDAKIKLTWDIDDIIEVEAEISDAHFFLNGEEIEIIDIANILSSAEEYISCDYDDWKLAEEPETGIEPDYYEEYLLKTRLGE